MTDNVDVLRVREPTIHRFPQNLRRIGTERDYIAPRTVALGPYYHGVAELGAMEEVKLAAVSYFFEGLAGESREEAYKKIIPIARGVRGCYADAGALAGITDDEFATMMFVDGCFFVKFMASMISIGEDTTNPLRRLIQPHMLGIMRDLMLLENQIPWPVVQFLMALARLRMGGTVAFLVSCLHGSFPTTGGFIGVDIDEPSHLLCLFLSNIVEARRRPRRRFSGTTRVKVSTSAAELAEIGINLRACEATTKFSGMGIVKGLLCAQLSLPPLHLEMATACWLVNMAAFEMYTEAVWTNDCSINSYLAIVSLLITSKEDVRELRAKGIVQGFGGDQTTLDFFEGLSWYLCPGHAYVHTIVDLEDYKRKRWLWIAIYRFLYNNGRTILTVLSLVGVLVGIFKALFSLKQH